MSNKSEHPEYIVKSVSCAFEIIEALTEAPTGLSLMQLADRFELTRNKAFRLMSTLCDTGLVERDPQSALYRLGPCSVALGQKFLMSSSMVHSVHPIIEQLARKHGEAVYMSVIKDEDVLFIDMVDSDQPVKATSLLGRRLPFSTTAAGKVIKALDSRDVLERFFKRRGRQKMSADAVSTLVSELEEIRSKGVAVGRDDTGRGFISVAVAVRDYAGKAVCAITLIVPSVRMLAGRLENEIIPSMLAGAEELSQKFGYTPAYA